MKAPKIKTFIVEVTRTDREFGDEDHTFVTEFGENEVGLLNRFMTIDKLKLHDNNLVGYNPLEIVICNRREYNNSNI